MDCAYCHTSCNKTYRVRDEGDEEVEVCRACWMDTQYCAAKGQIPQNQDDAAW